MNIRNAETEKLAADLAALTGESKTQAVTKSLKDRLEREKRRRAQGHLVDELDEIARHCASLPVLDSRKDEGILGYDKHGLPR